MVCHPARLLQVHPLSSAVGPFPFWRVGISSGTEVASRVGLLRIDVGPPRREQRLERSFMVRGCRTETEIFDQLCTSTNQIAAIGADAARLHGGCSEAQALLEKS